MTLSAPMSVAGQVAIPGIIGGLGPLAHIRFEQILLERSCCRGAKCDQDYLEWVLINAAPMPDRTQSFKGQLPSCTPWLVQYGQRLQRAGADFLIVICNTAHIFYAQVQPQLSLPWIPLMQGTTQLIGEQFPAARRVGILATDGTLQAQLYHQSLEQFGLMPICPAVGSPMQKRIMQSIYHPQWGIKTTGSTVHYQALAVLTHAMHWLAAQGADVVIAGCTELSVGLVQITALPVPWIDPLTAIADITLDLAWGNRALGSLLAA